MVRSRGVQARRLDDASCSPERRDRRTRNGRISGSQRELAAGRFSLGPTQPCQVVWEHRPGDVLADELYRQLWVDAGLVRLGRLRQPAHDVDDVTLDVRGKDGLDLLELLWARSGREHAALLELLVLSRGLVLVHGPEDRARPNRDRGGGQLTSNVRTASSSKRNRAHRSAATNAVALWTASVHSAPRS